MKTCESVRTVILSILKDQTSAVLFSRKGSVLPKFLGSDFAILHNYISSLGDHFGTGQSPAHLCYRRKPGHTLKIW